MNPIQRRLAALEHGMKPSAVDALDCSQLDEAEMLYLISIYDRRIAGLPIGEDEAAEFRRLDALVFRQPGAPASDMSIAQIEEEFARTEQMGWRAA